MPENEPKDLDRLSQPEVLMPLQNEISLPPAPAAAHFYQKPAAKVFSGCIFLTIACWAFNEFLQVRGYVNPVASRIFLIILGAALLAFISLIAINLLSFRWTAGVFLFLVLLAGLTWLDKITMPHVRVERLNSSASPSLPSPGASSAQQPSLGPTKRPGDHKPTKRANGYSSSTSAHESQTVKGPPTPPVSASVDPLLKRAESAVDGCKGFLTECNRRGEQVRQWIILKNAEPDVTEATKGQYARWVWGNKADQDNTRYAQIYRDEFQNVIHSMLLSGATEADPSIDWSRWSGVRTCLDLEATTASYADHLRSKQMKGTP
jgi:hypothetical protein